MMSATSRGGRFMRRAWSSRTVDGECIQGTGRRAEMLARQVQIDGRLFEVTMAEQHLDGPQICTSLK